MDRGVASLAWLVDVARRARLPNADTLELSGVSSAADAWERVAAHCGITVDDLAHEVSEALRLPVARLERRDVHVDRLVPDKLARRFQVVALRESERQIVVATADPLNDEVEAALGFATGRAPLFEIATPAAIAAALGGGSGVSGVMRALAPDKEDSVALVRRSSSDEACDGSDDAPVVKLTRLILRNAVHERASDVHFEPAPGNGTVRFRVDGVMRVHMRMPMLALSRVVARIKVMGSLDIADRLRPQDGRATFEVEGVTVDLRISTVPTRDAEKCVIRLLRKGVTETLDDLQLPARDLRAIRSLIGHRNGIVVVTGPTGSGKTTTLYAAIHELNNGETNISTVEDPIEYELLGITQMQVEPRREFTFATALRAILRQDPDVILVGEIRDEETASIAVQASMTGHLVLTTLHTNDAVSAIARLADIGVERPAIANTLRGVVAQRLVRRVCPHCAEKVDVPDEQERRLATGYGVQPVVRARGCAACGQTGYRGRLAIFEILPMNAALQKLVAGGASMQELQAAAAQAGMRSLRAAALQRVSEGETTLQEVERVVGDAPEDLAATAPPATDGTRVLLVDDDPMIRKVARHVLEENAYDVVEAASAEEALDRLQSDHAVSLAVLDIVMPGMHGDELLRRLREMPATATLPVIVLTGSGDPEYEVQLMEDGADDYIRKPLTPKRFLARVKAALRRAAA